MAESGRAQRAAREPSRASARLPDRARSTQLLRGVFLILSSFVVLTMILSLAGEVRARTEARAEQPDFPDLFRQIDLRLQKSYLDLDRVKPRQLVERALQAVERRAEEIYVEKISPDKPYVTVHVGDLATTVDLHRIRTRRQAVTELESIFQFIARNYRGDLALNDLRYAAANGYLTSIDPHTLVFTPQGFEEFEVHIKGEIYGVGMMVGATKEGKLQVKQVLKGTPAFRAGFKADDVIHKIGDESTINMTVNEAVKLIRGPKGSEVVLTIKRKGEDGKLQTLPISVERDRVEIKSVESKLITKSAADSSGKGGRGQGVGYVKVTNFDQNTTPALLRNLKELEEENGGPLKGLVLDLRGNSGGLLNQAIDMCDAFLEKGDIVVTARKGNNLSRTRARDDGDEPEYPIIALADQNSASGAEIVLGALQKNGRGLVLGTRSFGKGSVQQLQRLSYGAQLKITVSEYLIPGDISIQENGVVPDILAEEIYLDEDLSELFPADRRGEGDYESRIISRYARDETPAFSLKYLADEPDKDEGPTAQERFIAGELTPERNQLVRIALELLELDQKPRRLLRDTAGLEKLAAKLEQKIVARLDELGIDWTEGPRVSTGRPELSLELATKQIEAPSPDPEDPIPVNRLELTAKVENRGKAAVHRVRARSRSDVGLLDELELLFGKIEPGATAERKIVVNLPYFPRAQNNEVVLELRLDGSDPFSERAFDVAIGERQRPAFAYSATLTDAEGKTVSHLAPGQGYRLRTRITNVGGGPAHRGVSILRNSSGREVFLRQGRVEFENLAPGAETAVDFVFDIRPDSKAKALRKDDYEFELTLYESYSNEGLTRDLLIPPRGSDRAGFPNGELFRPPVINLELAAASTNDATSVAEPILVTDQAELFLRANVTSGSANFRAWITHLPLAIEAASSDKLYFARSAGQSALDIKTPVPLEKGINLFTVVTRDLNGIESRRSLVVRRN